MTEPRQDDGFTLIDMAVALVLMGLLTLLITTSLPLLTQSAQRVAQASAEDRLLVATHRLLSDHMDGLVRQEKDEARDGELAFDGQRDGLIVVTMLPQALQGERQRRTGAVTFRIEEREGGYDLIYAPEEVDYRRTLIRSDQPIRFSYFGTLKDNAGWYSEWRDQNTLPRLVKLSVTGLPDMIYRLPLSPQGDPG